MGADFGGAHRRAPGGAPCSYHYDRSHYRYKNSNGRSSTLHGFPFSLLRLVQTLPRRAGSVTIFAIAASEQAVVAVYRLARSTARCPHASGASAITVERTLSAAAIARYVERESWQSYRTHWCPGTAWSRGTSGTQMMIKGSSPPISFEGAQGLCDLLADDLLAAEQVDVDRLELGQHIPGDAGNAAVDQQHR